MTNGMLCQISKDPEEILVAAHLTTLATRPHIIWLRIRKQILGGLSHLEEKIEGLDSPPLYNTFQYQDGASSRL